MAFVIENKEVAFEDYASLESYNSEYPCVNDIVDFCTEWFNEEIAYFKFKTSGSTGKPKTIRHSRESMLKSAELTAHYFHFETGMNALLSLPVHFVAGKMMIVRAILKNLNLHISKIKLNPFEGVTIDNSEDIHFAPMTPMQMTYAFTNHKALLNKCNKILLGGGPVDDNLVNKIIEIKGEVFLGYGMTETLTHIAVKNIKTENKFKALPGIKFKVNPDNCLIIIANHISDIVKTTDIVKLYDENSFEWLRRKDNVINSGGIKVFPEDVEKVLGAFINGPFIITGVPDKVLGEAITLVISNDNNLEIIKQKIEDLNMSKSKPRKVCQVTEFPFTKTGKVNRKLMKKLILKSKISKL